MPLFDITIGIASTTIITVFAMIVSMAGGSFSSVNAAYWAWVRGLLQ